MLRDSRNFRNRSENACSSCRTRIISVLSILSAVQAVIAVAVAKRSPTDAGDRLLSNEVACEEERDCGFFTFCRNNCEFCAALLKIENGVSWISLRKEDLLWLQLDDSSS